jgi:hypothetical protein
MNQIEPNTYAIGNGGLGGNAHGQQAGDGIKQNIFED